MSKFAKRSPFGTSQRIAYGISSGPSAPVPAAAGLTAAGSDARGGAAYESGRSFTGDPEVSAVGDLGAGIASAEGHATARTRVASPAVLKSGGSVFACAARSSRVWYWRISKHLLVTGDSRCAFRAADPVAPLGPDRRVRMSDLGRQVRPLAL